jgi:hypothetical protein
MLGPLLVGLLVDGAGYGHSFQIMALVTAVVLFLTWVGLKRDGSNSPK